MRAFVLLHFGDNDKYFELELYFVQMLNKYSDKDIDKLYLYLPGTPEYYITTMNKYFTKTIEVKDITEFKKDNGAAKFESWYTHFNTLKTCNFINGYKLDKYSKICILESDMIITRNISDIFNLPAPSILFINEDNEIIKNPSGRRVNGGILLFKPSRYLFNKALTLLPGIISSNSKYPNEELFLLMYPKIYNLPERYNYCHYHLSKVLDTDPLPVIIHFNETKYKYLDIIKDGYKNKFSAKKRAVAFFKNNFYDKWFPEISKIMAGNPK